MRGRPYWLLVSTCLLILSSQVLAEDSLWQPWLPKLEARVRAWITSNANKGPFFKDYLGSAYLIPNTSLGPNDDLAKAMISLERDGRLSVCLRYPAGGQFWSTTRVIASSCDLGELPVRAAPRKAVSQQLSLALHHSSFEQACASLGKLGVKLSIVEPPTVSGRRSISFHRQDLRQIIGRTLALWGMEAWQSGNEYLVIQKPIRQGMTEDQAKASLQTAIGRELARHGVQAIDEPQMTNEFMGRLALAANRLKAGDTRLTDLSLADQAEWLYLSERGSVLRQANTLAQVVRFLSDGSSNCVAKQ